MALPPIIPSRRTGNEHFGIDGNGPDVRLIDFWQWSMSDLVSNTTRGILAEFIVAKALDIKTPVRTEWDSYDLEVDETLRIEVKSSAYIQSWYQKDYSQISFGIQPTHAWSAESGQYADESRRQADVYVFALLAHKDQDTINPLNLDQWTFFVLPTKTLNRRASKAKTISLASLKSFEPIQCTYSELKDAVISLQGKSAKK